MNISNLVFEDIDFNDKCLFIFTLGFQQRSFHIFEKLRGKLNNSNTIILILGEDKSNRLQDPKIKEIYDSDLSVEFVSYSDLRLFSSVIDKFLDKSSIKEFNNIHVDYSAMPKSWYCRLPKIILEKLKENFSISFWYSEGEYPLGYTDYPSAGIDSFSYFSGKPSLVIDERRTHIIALGFDVKRTTAITTLLDPEDVINCYSYNPTRVGFEKSLEEINSSLISRASSILKFDINNFSFMFAKINETVNEILPNEVIIIPDGPKPLIFAMSLVASYKEKEGVTCLHVSGNPEMFKLMDVIPTGNIIGVMLTNL